MFDKILFNFVKSKKHEKKVNYLYKKKFSNENIKVIFTHKNNVFVVFKKEQKLFRKFSLSKLGGEKIKSDYSGLKWYCSKKKIDSKKIIIDFKEKNDCSYLDTIQIKGEKIKSWLPLKKNYTYIKSSLDHYKNIFLYQKKTKIHGDLTLENIFFNNKNIFFIDWEFFNCKKKIWGYDAVYLVLSSISIPFIVNKSVSTDDKYLFLKLWKILLKMQINKKLLKDPYNYFNESIRNDIILNKSRLLSKSKFFPFITPKKFQNEIVKLIGTIK